MRLDLTRPLTRGNTIMFKGARSTGKTHVAMNAIKQFVKEDLAHNHAIYISVNS